MRLFLSQDFGKVFLTFPMSIWLSLKTWELFLVLINLIIRWSLYLPSIFKIGFSSDESGHLYPLRGVFKIELSITYLQSLLATLSSWETTYHRIIINQVDFRVFYNLFRKKWFNNFLKYSIFSYNLVSILL